MGDKLGSIINMEKVLPFAAMVAVQCIFNGLRVLSKSAMSNGMSNYVFIVYSTALGLLPIFLAHLILHRKNKPPPITFPLLRKLFVLGLLGTTIGQYMTFIGISYSSPILSSAIGNLDPAVTFLLAVIFRMEKVNRRLFRSYLKILGTIVSVMGAFIMTLYKGPALWTSLMPSNPLELSQPIAGNWGLGGFCFALGSLSTVTSNILIASILKEYPSVMTTVLLSNVFAAIQCIVVSLIAERDLNAWKLRPDIELVAILYSGVFCPLMLYLTVWCIGNKGPVFAAMFSPLGIIISAAMSAIFLSDALHVGSVVGAVIIVSGFYSVIWAQSKDQEKDELCTDHLLSSNSQKTPFLQVQP